MSWPQYIRNMLEIHAATRNLRSLRGLIMKISKSSKSTLSTQECSAVAQTLWNQLEIFSELKLKLVISLKREFLSAS